MLYITVVKAVALKTVRFFYFSTQWGTMNKYSTQVKNKNYLLNIKIEPL